MSHWPALAVSDYIALAGMFMTGLFAVFKMIQKIRTNDLEHLDAKIDLHHTTVMGTVVRIEEKIDDHVRDHALGILK